MKNDCPGGFYFVLNRKSMVPGCSLLIFIGYNYNYRKFLSFVDPEDAGIKKSVIPYLSNYPDQFDNF